MKIYNKNKIYFDLILKSFLFQNCEREIVEYAINHSLGQWKEFVKSEIVYNREYFEKSLGIVVKGALTVSKETYCGHQFIMNTLVPGDCFGGAAIFQTEPNFVATITAKTDTLIFFMPTELLLVLFKTDENVILNYLTFLSDSLTFLNKKIDSFIMTGTKNRVIDFLLKNCKETDEGYIVDLEYNYSELAEYLGIGRSSLYRTLDKLSENGKIIKGNKNIKIMDIKGLLI